MKYSEFRNTYKELLKKYSDVSNIYETTNTISLVITEYRKSGSRWIVEETTKLNVTYEFYCNIFSSSKFFRSLGGYERTSASYTRAGYIPTEQISINPEKTKKKVYNFSIL